MYVIHGAACAIGPQRIGSQHSRCIERLPDFFHAPLVITCEIACCAQGVVDHYLQLIAQCPRSTVNQKSRDVLAADLPEVMHAPRQKETHGNIFVAQFQRELGIQQLIVPGYQVARRWKIFCTSKHLEVCLVKEEDQLVLRDASLPPEVAGNMMKHLLKALMPIVPTHDRVRKLSKHCQADFQQLQAVPRIANKANIMRHS